MSSILDALNKVEREQAEEEELVNGEVDAATAAKYLYGNAARGRRGGALTRLGLSRTVLGVASMVVVAMVAAVVTASLVMWRHGFPEAGTPGSGEAAAPPPPVDSQVITPPAVPQPPPASGEFQGTPEPAVVPPASDPRSAQPGTDASGALQAHAPAPPSVSELAKTAPRHDGQPPLARPSQSRPPAPRAPQFPAPEAEDLPAPPPPLQETAPPSREAIATASSPEPFPEDLNMRTLSRLTPSVQAQLGLPRLKINLVGNNARSPWALINYRKVYINEFIPGAGARLMAVDVFGVALEVGGKYYFLAK